MAFSDLVATVDSHVQSVYSEATVVIHPQSRVADIIVSATKKNPKYEEDYNPLIVAPASNNAPTNVLLFIRLDGLPVAPLRGDTATWMGEDYDVYEVDADLEGGGTLKLRKRNQRWDQ